MTNPARQISVACLEALEHPASWLDRVEFDGEGELPSAFAVSDLASAGFAVAGLCIAQWLARSQGRAPVVRVDRRLASYWYQTSIRPIGWELPGPWDPIAGDYECRDGWIRLHTNAPRHRAAAERVLGARADKAAMAKVVRLHDGDALESAIVAAGGCAARMQTASAWSAHPQGIAVATEPLIHITRHRAAAPSHPPGQAGRPLQGLRVLDLTRVLAGPVASRFLAAYGAQVLRIDPPDWDEPAVVPEVTPGKRCARLDLRQADDRRVFQGLLAQADVMLHGYRNGALDALGFDAATRRMIAPGLVDVSLDAYGWTGPWAGRRGFDSLVQMSTGIAEAGRRWRGGREPVPLPAQALDHATGYLMAAAAIGGILSLHAGNGVTTARLSLARTAALLLGTARPGPGSALAPLTPQDVADAIEQTSWGPAKRLRAPLQIAGAPMRWTVGARRLGADRPCWDGTQGSAE